MTRLAIVAIVAVTIAGGAWRGWSAAHPDAHQSADARAYARLAIGLARTGHYSATNMHDPLRWPPGAPFVFSLAERVSPRDRGDRPADVPAAYPVQAALSTAIVPGAAALGWLAGGPAAAVLAAAATAFYPPLATSPSDLLTEPLGGVLLIVGVLLVVLGLRRFSLWRLAAGGVMLGLTVLTRADLLPVPFVLALVGGVVWGRARGLAPALRGSAALLAGALILLVPWTIYVSTRLDRFAPVVSGGGANLFVGTYLPGRGTIFGTKEHLAAETKRAFPTLRNIRPANLPSEFVLAAVARRRPHEQRDVALRKEGLKNLSRAVVHDPGGLAVLFARKLWRLWGRYTLGGRKHRSTGLAVVHLILIVLAFAGIALALVRRLGPEPWLALGLVLTISAVNALLVSEPRHALPTLPVLFAVGAAGWVHARRGALASGD